MILQRRFAHFSLQFTGMRLTRFARAHRSAGIGLPHVPPFQNGDVQTGLGEGTSGKEGEDFLPFRGEGVADFAVLGLPSPHAIGSAVADAGLAFLAILFSFHVSILTQLPRRRVIR